MNAADMEGLEKSLKSAGMDLRYPPTPAIASAVMPRLRARPRRRVFPLRLTWALVTLIILLSALMLVPPARAAILDFIQIGVVRIFRGPNPPPAPAPTAGTNSPILQAPLTATPVVTVPSATTTQPSLPDFAGETTLADAQAGVKFRILLPTYPADLGMPDHVYLQNPGDSMLILVWLDRAQTGHVRMSLHEIAPGSWAIGKFNPPVIEEVLVNGKHAAWTEGPYMVEMKNGNYEDRRLIIGHVLIWQQGDITYRLETDLPVDEAIKVAESLKPAP